EARAAEGDVKEATRRLAGYEADSVRAGLPRFLALTARCRALIALGGGHVEDALAELETALTHHREFDSPYQLGRTLFVLGSIQRRENRKALAAQTLTDAAARFGVAGAALWADRARLEHARIGGPPASTG